MFAGLRASAGLRARGGLRSPVFGACVAVPVSQAQSLIDAMDGLGRTPPAFEGFPYSGGGHQITTLAASPARAGALLADMWPPDP